MERILHLDIADSTNNKLKELAAAGAPEGQIVIAQEQSAGKGRRGRSFASPKGAGIYFSYLFKPEKMTAELSALTAWTAVAVHNAIKAACGMETGIKWVNDLVLNKKKLCGILTEMSIEDGHIKYVVIGIGINVNHKPADFPEEVREIATSLHIESGQTFSREAITEELIKELDKLREDFPLGKKAYLEAYREACVTIGKEVCVISGDSKRHAKALRINDDFSLEVEYENGQRESLSSGEVSVRGLEGYV